MARNEKVRETSLEAEVAPAREGVGLGANLHCAAFESGGPVDAEVVGGGGEHDSHYRVKIDSLGGQEWLVKRERVDAAKRTWEHVAADYPALGADKEFDEEFRAYLLAPPKQGTPSAADKAAAAFDSFADKHLPPEVAAAMKSVLTRTQDKVLGGPKGSVLARWTGKGLLDAPFLDRSDRTLRRGAKSGDEGWFAQKTVDGYRGSFVLL